MYTKKDKGKPTRHIGGARREMKENIGKQSRDEMVLYVGGGRHDMYTIETEEGTGTL